MAVGLNQWYHFGAGASPILEPILVEIGMFTGGTSWILTHGHMWVNINAMRGQQVIVVSVSICQGSIWWAAPQAPKPS